MATYLDQHEAKALDLLSAAANTNAPCPSMESLGREMGLPREPTTKVLKRLEAFGLIRIQVPSKGQRVIVICETGKKTAPTQIGGGPQQRALAQAGGSWPKRTMTAEEFDEALAKAGRFEDDPRAKRDRGSHGMPSRQTYGRAGISDVYGSCGIRHGGGVQF